MEGPGNLTLQAQTRQAAIAHERSLSLEERRRTGTVYTPGHLVEFILDLAGYTPDSPIESKTVLDPACGCGAFLEVTVRRLVERWSRLHTRSNVSALLEMVERNLAGLDKDAHAAELAAQLVRHTLGEVVGQESVPPSFFETNVTQNDFLDVPRGDRSQLDLFESKHEERFDFIVGNPPYVTTTRLSSEEKDLLRGRFTTAHGRLDLYSLFFERALELLADGGTLAFITPDKFLTSESAVLLRKLISYRGAVQAVARFRSHRIFDGAATVPCVTVIRKTRSKGRVAYFECEDRDREPRHVEIVRRREMPPPPSMGEAWHFLDPRLRGIAASLTQGHPTLEHVSCRISAGIATGRDNIYVLPPGVGGELEPELLHPCLRGQDLKPFEIESTGSRIIVPFTHEADGVPRLVNLDEYPRIRAYLEAHRSELESRHCVRRWSKAWYDIHDPWTLDVTHTPKIVFPDVANSNRFAFDAGKYCPLHSAYYIVPQDVDPEYLTALLNSDVTEFLIRLFAPMVKDGFSRYRKQFVKELPVPQVGRRTQRSVIRAAARGDDDLLNETVADLFSLSPRNADLVDRFVLEARGHRKPDIDSKAA